MVTDYNRFLHGVYEQGRTLSGDVIGVWMDAMAEHLEQSRNATVLDLGAGTGRFSAPIAEHFSAVVVAVDPSIEMLRKARANRPHPRVRYLVGRAEMIPCADGSMDAAFLSMMIHHVHDIPAACRELYRVLRPGRCVFVRNAFKDRFDSIPWYDYFPSAKEIDNARMPSIEEVTSSFVAAQFEPLAQRMIAQQTDPSFRAYCDRIRTKALSIFEMISDEEFQEGIRAMEEVVVRETDPTPVLESVDWLVFRRCP